MNWLSCSQVVVDQPTDCMSARPSDRQPNQCFYFSFVKNTHTFCRVVSQLLTHFANPFVYFFQWNPIFTRRKWMGGESGEGRKSERDALQAQISYDTFCSWHMISSDKLACGDFILCGQFFSSLFSHCCCKFVQKQLAWYAYGNAKRTLKMTWEKSAHTHTQKEERAMGRGRVRKEICKERILWTTVELIAINYPRIKNYRA